MDSAAGQQRDMVYCHECENEWYRDEHGLTCPECHSDFTEIIEPDHDPRADGLHIPADDHPQPRQQQHGDFYAAPDPDEDDIDALAWNGSGAGQQHHQHQQQHPGQPQQPGLLGILGGLFGTALGSPGPAQRPQSPESTQPRASSVPGRGNTTFHRWQSPNGSVTFTYSSTIGGGGPGLWPRNANGPQPHQTQPETINDMMAQMFMNIGAMPGYHAPGPRFGPHGGVFVVGGDPGMGGGMGANPFAHLFQMLGMPAGGRFGDAVFSQEEMDRIITQLMEQHQSGNAPGPASEEAIKNLPTREIARQDVGENGKAECTICMDEVELGAKVTVLPCSHWFHFECIHAWLSEHDTCPHCRQGIMPKDGDAGNNRAREPSQAPLHDTHSPEYHGPRQMPAGMPGMFRQESGSRENPLAVPSDSPSSGSSSSTGTARRSSSAPGARPGGSRQNSAQGLFQRMRETFGGSRDGGEASGSRGQDGS